MNQPLPPAQEEMHGGGEAMPESDEMKAKRMAIVESFAAIIKDKRKEAIEARRSSGIEQDWTEDEEHYEGVDDANRGTSRYLKGRTTTDGLRESKKDQTTRSTVFLKITRPYVDAAAARVSDMLLPTDDRNFKLKPGKIAELTKALKDAGVAPTAPAPTAPPQAPQGGLMAGIKRMFSPGQGVPPAVPAQPQNAAQEAQAVIAKAKASAERAQDVIDDYLAECRYHAEVRKAIESAAKVGSGILKGPHPELKRSRAASESGGGWTVEMVEKIAPTSKWVNHWNFYPDGNCGANIQKGSFVFECDDITARGLTDLMDTEGYIPEMIQLCLDEGPTSPVDGTRKNKPDQKTQDKDLFQIWYFHGQVTKAEMEAAGCRCGDKASYPAMVTMVNDRVIKVTLSPLDSGEFPYDVMVWQARNDHWAGIGVARQMRECQKGANAAVRNLMDNAGLAAGPMFIIDRSKIEPANGKWEIAPRKIWWTKVDEDTVDVTKAFTIITLPDLQQQLLNLVQFWVGKAEEVTGLPMLLQGQMGEHNPTDKVGIAQIQNNNGSTVLRRIARTFDDRVTEPHIGRYYEWLLLYGPDDAKGDFAIDALGSSALVERDLQQQQLPQLIGLSLEPRYGLDPELVIKEVLKSMRLDTMRLELSDEKKAEMASRPPPEDPRVTAAKIMAKGKEDALVAGVQSKKMELDAEAKENALDREVDKQLASIDAQLRGVEIDSEERQHLETQKVLLARVALQLKTQMQLAARAEAAPQVATPGMEPRGRAPEGQAFQK
jgi:hypothetical protein